MTSTEKNIFTIKNMVCPRCILAVEDIFEQLNLPIVRIQLGQVATAKPATKKQSENLKEMLQKLDFELLEMPSERLVNDIKSFLIDQIHYQSSFPTINLSTVLAEKFHYNYSSLSRLFSQEIGMTIEKFVLHQKIERAKELLFYDELNVSEVADQLHFNSLSHFSRTFKAFTGFTPSQFKKQSLPKHQFLDEI